MYPRYAMKCLYKKRIKMKQGERLAVNERDILARVDTPFIVRIQSELILEDVYVFKILKKSKCLQSEFTRFVWTMRFTPLTSCALFWIWWMVGTCITISLRGTTSPRLRQGEKLCSTQWQKLFQNKLRIILVLMLLSSSDEKRPTCLPKLF